MKKINLSDYDLPFEASDIMSYHEVPVADVGNLRIIGYLSDDTDCENPLTSSDGMGAIHTALRGADKEERHAMQAALGLNSEWEPDLEYGAVASRAESQLKALLHAEYVPTMTAWAMQYAEEGYAPFVLMEDILSWLQHGYPHSDMEFSDEDRDVLAEIEPRWSAIRKAAWDACRTSGEIGDKDAVLLDVYQHGGQSWSVAGSGMQCTFDTSSGAGVWVPDDSCRYEIDRRAPVYEKGVIRYNGALRGDRKYSLNTFKQDASGATLHYSDEAHPMFEHWQDAFQYLKALEVPVRVSPESGRAYAAEEVARGCLESYNLWLSGACYGVVVATFANIANEGDDAEWEQVSSEECWGYLGDDGVMSEVKAWVAAEAEHQCRNALIAA